MTRYYTLILCLIGSLSLGWSQQDNLSASKHIKLAKQLSQENKYAAAAGHYEAAWNQKPKKLEWLFEAAKNFLQAREYRKAAESFGTLKDNKMFPQSRFQYAVALQQSGQYDEAIPEFLLYLNTYEAKDREAMKDRIEEYVNGCTMAIRQSDSTVKKKFEIEHLSETINSPDDDLAPVPFGDDILYFTNLVENKGKLMRTQQLSKDWSLAAAVENLPIPQGISYGNGTFSKDGSRFYYTQCTDIVVKKEKKRTCAIYYMNRSVKGWEQPVKLSDKVNTEGGMTTHPYIFERNGREVLFFSSNRTGGKGNMDLWHSSRSLKNEDFSEAQNLGGIINTDGDDVTPFVDTLDNTLYFASNGRATYGGLDIFKSKGNDKNSQWTAAENMGATFNSGADDWYFTLNKSRTSGYFVSNKALGMEKLSSRDDDIYGFKVIQERTDLAVLGQILEKEQKIALENTRVSLFEKREGGGGQRLLSSLMCAEGAYQFTVLQKKGYVLEVEKEGYRMGDFAFNTKDSTKNIQHDFLMEKYVELVSIPLPAETPKKSGDKIVNESPSKKDKKETKTTTKPTEKPTKGDHSIVNTEGPAKTENDKAAKKNSGVIFKIQVMAYDNLDNANRRRIARVDDLGDIDTEKALVNGKTYTRVMLSDFDSYSEAATTLKKVKDRSLADAFIVKYEDGKRTNKSR